MRHIMTQVTLNWEEHTWLSISIVLCPASVLRNLLVTIQIVGPWVLHAATNTSEKPVGSKTLLISYQTAWCHNAEDKNLKSQKIL